MVKYTVEPQMKVRETSVELRFEMHVQPLCIVDQLRRV